MSTVLNNLTYRSGENVELVFARSKPTYINAANLVAGIETILDVPVGAGICIFSSDGDFFTRADGAASVPLTDVSDGSASELNPAQWDVHDVAKLHCIAPENTIVTFSFYR